ncbi:flagellar hook-basal body complex protein FliE [Falsibacillus pallidus]|uniref:Flagellar hook-basal body complex protein FliE n=2 Tax=Falsibacillus pallidus TaxID=493781 RepID=A0A370GUW0_9BACI|nr:flagellar hook-basal body complex protein FliE [Falsibacillus pallidus]RDI47462.1 flagellar hook-basal body complex protein FliE [Falsibacillus pallidus]
MAINNISSMTSSILRPSDAKISAGNLQNPYKAQTKFADYLKESLNEVNESQNIADKLTGQLAQGKDIDLHQVMIASQKASITMQTTIEIRNKVVEAYQEIMRMQV